MNQTFIREISLIGEENFQKLQNARVAVFGIGGVGSYAAEALVRAGVGHLLFVDGDTVAESNLNRQLVALRSTIGKNKANVMRERALDISPETEIETFEGFFDETTADSFDFFRFSYVADCIDPSSAAWARGTSCAPISGSRTSKTRANARSQRSCGGS